MNCQNVDHSAYFYPVGHRKGMYNTVMLNYRHGMSSSLQKYVSIWTSLDILALCNALETATIASIRVGKENILYWNTTGIISSTDVSRLR